MLSFFDSIADIYDETRSLPKETMHDVIEVMAHELKDIDRALELGVGTGRFADPLRRKNIDVVGIDLSLTMLKLARAKGLDTLILGDACNLPFKDFSFDSIICVHVLHLLKDCKKAFVEMKRVGAQNMVSVILGRSNFMVMEEYKEALAACGYHLKLPGVRERDLKSIVAPKKQVLIHSFQENYTVGGRLRFLRERKHSYTTDTPNEVHECALKYLEDKYLKELDSPVKSEIEVAVWNLSELAGSYSD